MLANPNIWPNQSKKKTTTKTIVIKTIKKNNKIKPNSLQPSHGIVMINGLSRGRLEFLKKLQKKLKNIKKILLIID